LLEMLAGYARVYFNCAGGTPALPCLELLCCAPCVSLDSAPGMKLAIRSHPRYKCRQHDAKPLDIRRFHRSKIPKSGN